MNPDPLRPGTFREFRAVLRREAQSLTLRDRARLWWTLLRAAMRVGGVSKEQWRKRMKTCRKCPIFDPGLRRCRPYDNATFGCGCFTPWQAKAKAPYPKGCWGAQHLPGQGIGWPAI